MRRNREESGGLIRLAGAVCVLLVIATSPGLASNYSSNSMEVQVYSDGSVFVTQNLTVNRSSTSVEVPLLSVLLVSLAVTDGNGSPLSYKISGSNVTVYTLGASAATLRYDTQNLTSKSGTVWTLDFTAAFNVTVVLPAGSTVSSVSSTPYSISNQQGSPVLTLSSGQWVIVYGVAVGALTATTSSGTTGGQPPGLDNQTEGLIAGFAALAVALVVIFWWRRRRLDLGPKGADLRPDDVQVLNFIQEKGGKVLEPEIRTRFALPKTSGWRQIKRLERLGYVKVTKVGSQNQIELLRARDLAA